MKRGRFQAQGGGLEVSEAWATNNDITKEDGYAKINQLKNKLSREELKERKVAFVKAKRFVCDSPATGHFAFVSKSFSNDLKKRSIRVDIEIRKENAFIDNDE